MKKILLLIIILIPCISKSQSFEFKPYVDQNVSCYGNNDGYIQSIAVPDGEYQFTISRLSFKDTNTSGTFNKLKPGVYKVCCSNGKTIKCTKLTVTEPKKINAKFLVERYPTKTSLGELSLEVTGGTTVIQPYLITWSNSKGTILNPWPEFSNFEMSINNIPNDVYSIKIEDDNGCFFEKSFKLTNKK
jgi:hypothetical protein